MRDHHGSCHCGNLQWTLRSRFAASELPGRACQCEFVANTARFPRPIRKVK
jgi:hypothetical protein